MVVRTRQKKIPQVRIRKRIAITEAPITSPMMLKFIDEFPKDWNAKRAVIAAGYSTKNVSVRINWLLRNIRVRKAIEEIRERNRKASELTREDLLGYLSKIIKCDVRKLFREDGITMKQVNELDDGTAAAIAGLEIEDLYVGRGEDREMIGKTKKYRLADKLKAIELAGRSLGLFPDKYDSEFLGGDLTIRIMEDKDSTEDEN